MKHSNLISGHPVPQINLDSALQASYEYSLVIRTEAARSAAPPVKMVLSVPRDGRQILPPALVSKC